MQIATVLLLFAFVQTVQSQTLIKSFTTADSFAQLGNVTFFAADDGVHGVEVWKTDGTAQGTSMVKDISPGFQSSRATYFFAYNGKVYFSASDGINGDELWSTDGSASGTVMVKDINTSHYNGNTGSSPKSFIVYKGALYFTANEDGAYTRTLWKTDGTVAGTTKFAGEDYGGITQLVIVKNTLYFLQNGRSLWKTNGTKQSVKQVIVDDYYNIEQLRNVADQLYFFTSYTYTHGKVRLYTINPDDDKPVMLRAYEAIPYGDNDIDNLTAVNNKLYFSIRTTDTYGNGTETLWASNGTVDGTVPLKSFAWNRYIYASNSQGFTAFNNKLYFSSSNDHKLWESDGTEAGTKQAANITLQTGFNPFVYKKALHFFSGYPSPQQLNKFDGSAVSSAFTIAQQPSAYFIANDLLIFTIKGALWTDAPASQLEVYMNSYQLLAPNGTSKITTEADSTVSTLITVNNKGSQELIFGEISVVGNSFYVNGQPPKSVQPGKSAKFNLIYSPDKEETVTAQLMIKSNDQSGAANFATNISGIAVGKATKKSGLPVDGLLKEIVFTDTLSMFKLNNLAVSENAVKGSSIGSFNIDNNTSSPYKYQLVTGSGDADNAAFLIADGELKLNVALDYDIKSTYSIRVKAFNGSLTFEKQFVINVNDIQSVTQTNSCPNTLSSLNYTLNGVVYAGSRLIALASGGTVLNSDDGGQTWKMIKTGSFAAFNNATFPNAKTGYIIGGYNTLMKTENGGDSWFPLLFPYQGFPEIKNIVFPSVNTGYVVADAGIYKTTDGGRNWIMVHEALTGAVNGWFFNDNEGYICGTTTSLYHTADGGKTFDTIELPVAGFNNIVFTDSKTGYISTRNGVLKTTDAGKTWKQGGSLGGGATITRLAFIDNTTGFAITGYDYSAIFKTTDGGATWQQEINVSGYPTGIAVNKTTGKYCLVGRGGYYTYSEQGTSFIALNDGSSNWQQRSLTTNDVLYGGNMFSSGIGYTIGQRISKTIDGGVTWKEILPASNNFNWGRRAQFTTADDGVTSDGYSVYVTSNGGESWTKTLTDSVSIYNLLHFVNKDVGFYSNYNTAYKTVDAGHTWKKVLSYDFENAVSSMSFPTINVGYALGIGNVLRKTLDGGNTWTKYEFGADTVLTSTGFFTNDIGLVAGINGLVLRTEDGGKTWKSIYTQMLFTSAQIKIVDSNHAYLLNKNYGGGVNQIYETLDAGLTWNNIYQSWIEVYGLNVNDKRLFVTGADGSMLLSGNNKQPLNAGYIGGDSVVVAGVKYIYTMPAATGTNYKWLVTGAESVEYKQNIIVVKWKTAGKYSITVMPYNDCITADSRTMQIEVNDVADPLILGPDTVLSFQTNVSYSVTKQDNVDYLWTAAGAVSTVQDEAKVKVNWSGQGNGSISVIANNNKFNIKKTAVKHVLIKKDVAPVPENNFLIKINTATCRGENNGKITISAVQFNNYTAVVTGPSDYNSKVTFKDSTILTSLKPGVYNVCVTIDNNSTYQRCYQATITEPKELSLYTVVNTNRQIVTLNLGGADNYKILLNGKTYQTNSSQLDLPLTVGANKISITTDKRCQGIIERVLNVNKIVLYPNPFIDRLSIDLGGSREKSAIVEIRNAQGLLVYSKKINNDSGVITAEPGNLAHGAYILKLTLGQSTEVFKLIRE